MTTSPEDELIRFVAETEYQDLPDETIEFTKHLALKTAAGTLAGTEQPTGRRVAAYISERKGVREDAGVMGCGFQTSIRDAVLANGTFCHASELEDDRIYPDKGVSWDISTFPLTFSLADKYRLSGKEFITASAISLEVHARLCLPPTPGPISDIPLQSSSVASAVAASKSMRQNEHDIRHAMGLAWAGGFVFLPHTGTDAHYMDSAFQCVRGLESAQFAKEGLKGEPNMESIFNGIYGKDSVNPRNIVENLGEDWLFHGISLKKYPCCFFTHRYIDALRELRNEYSFDHNDVESVNIKVGPIEDNVVPYIHPKDTEEAKFSYPHLMAAVLIEGDVNYPQVDESVLNDPQYKDTRSKVNVEVYTDVEEVPLVKPATVSVIMKNGEIYKKERENMIGSQEERLSVEEYMDLYRKFTEGILSNDQIDKTAETFLDLENQKDISGLLRNLTYI